MPVEGFQHINTRSADVERTRDFYVRVLGLRVGDRPPFQSTGYWLYLGDQAVVHLVQRGPDDTRQALRAAGIPFREAVVPRDKTVQIFVHDPDGIKLELNFEQQ